MEIWKDIQGYEGLYQVSNTGRVRNKKRELKLIVRKRDGYVDVQLSKNNKFSTVKVHRLVANAFIPNPNGYNEINHKDENPANNRAENLEWCNRRYNLSYGTRAERISKSNSKPVEQLSDGVVIRVWTSMRDAAKAGYKHGSISLCCNGKAKHHKGYQWRYQCEQTNDGNSVPDS